MGVHAVDRRRQGSGRAAAQADELLLQRRDEAARLGVRVCSEHIDPNHGVRPLKLLRRPELRAVDSQRRHQGRRRKMRGKCEGQAQRGRQLRAVGARSEQPDRNIRSGPRHRPHGLVRMHRPQQRLQLQNIAGKVLGGARNIPPQRLRRALIGAGRTAKTEIDAVAVKRLQRAELLGDDQWRVIGQHDAARSDADRPGARGNGADHHGGRGAGDARHVVMFGQPEPLVAPPFGMLREIERIAEGLRRVAALIDRRQIQNRKRNHFGLREHWARCGASAPVPPYPGQAPRRVGTMRFNPTCDRERAARPR